MFKEVWVAIWMLCLGLPVLAVGQVPSASPQRMVAVTFDDLPATAAPLENRCDPAWLQQFTDRLVGRIIAHALPATGFVTESRVCDDLREAILPALLTAWLDAGLELGNHTFSHRSFVTTPLEIFKADVVRGEAITASLLAEREKQLRYFRFPMLRIAPDRAKRAAFEQFLAGRGYTIAHVSIDNSEWIYSVAYERAKARQDSVLMRRIGADFIQHMEEVFAFNEQLSQDLLGYEVRHILLLHANTLNVDYLDALVAMMQTRGYTFISLEEALEDPAYRLPDPYTGPRGLSWLQRLAVGKEGQPRLEPEAAPYVQDLMNTGR